MSVGSEDGESVETAGARRDFKGRLQTTTTTNVVDGEFQRDRATPRQELKWRKAACRFGKAWTVDELTWRALAGGCHDAIRDAPSKSVEVGKRGRGESVGRVLRGRLEDVRRCKFFGISPREAVAMDPQHRMLLECAWEASESAGRVESDGTEGRGGEGGRVCGSGERETMRVAWDVRSGGAGFRNVSGVASSTCGRTGFVFFGRDGKLAISIDTACSSSLISVIYGARSVERGEEGGALCFGVQAC